MKIKFPYSLIMICSLLMVLFACTKQRAPMKVSGPDYASPATFYTTYQQKVQTFTVDSPGTGPIIGAQGTRLSGDASVFMFPGGQSVHYPFTLQLIEVYTGKDMILSNLPSVAGGQLLQTMGEISINAYKGSQLLVLRPGKKYFMELDTNTSLYAGMSVYYGFPNGSYNDWTNNVTTLNSSIHPDTLSAVINYPYFYALNIARMGWVSCAEIVPDGSPATISFTSSGTNTQNINVFLVFKNTHSVMQVYNLKSGQVPVGDSLTVVALSRDSNSGNTMVYDIQPIKVTTGQVVTLNMVNTSDANLLTALAQFK